MTEGPLLEVRPLQRCILHVDRQKGSPLQADMDTENMGILSVTRLMIERHEAPSEIASLQKPFTAIASHVDEDRPCGQ